MCFSVVCCGLSCNFDVRNKKSPVWCVRALNTTYALWVYFIINRLVSQVFLLKLKNPLISWEFTDFKKYGIFGGYRSPQSFKLIN